MTSDFVVVMDGATLAELRGSILAWSVDELIKALTWQAFLQRNPGYATACQLPSAPSAVAELAKLADLLVWVIDYNHPIAPVLANDVARRSHQLGIACDDDDETEDL